MIDDDYGMEGVNMNTSADDNNNVDYKVITYDENGTLVNEVNVDTKNCIDMARANKMKIPYLLARGTINQNVITSCGKEINNVSFVYSMLRAIKGEFSEDRTKGEINAKVIKREESSQTPTADSLETHVVDEGDASDELMEDDDDDDDAAAMQHASRCKRKSEPGSFTSREKRLCQINPNVSTSSGKFHVHASNVSLLPYLIFYSQSILIPEPTPPVQAVPLVLSRGKDVTARVVSVDSGNQQGSMSCDAGLEDTHYGNTESTSTIKKKGGKLLCGCSMNNYHITHI